MNDYFLWCVLWFIIFSFFCGYINDCCSNEYFNNDGFINFEELGYWIILIWDGKFKLVLMIIV